MSVRKIKKTYFNKKEESYFYQEDRGFLEPDENEQTYQISQKEIVKSVDITSSSKHFDLRLSHLGPYKIDYFRNGRNLLLGGRRGHVAVFDWITKDLSCEFNVRESVHAVKWLHMPTMFAVAQADWTYVYDEKGIEIHCLKRFYHVYELDFLPYHFLLVAVSDNGFLSWLDISTGNLVANFRMKIPRVTCLTHNDYNAITFTGHPDGWVRMWSPNNKEPLVQLFCHPSAIRDVVIDKRGYYMVTTSTDRSVQIWDLRNCQENLNKFRIPSVPNKLALSQNNILGIASGNVINIYKDFHQTTNKCTPYMRHRLDLKSSIISSVKFCPFEDVLGLGHQDGFTSLLVPGSGEPNFDAFEANPYMTKSQRREMEVKALMEKISSEFITLDPNFLINSANNRPVQNRYKEIMRKVERKSNNSDNTIGGGDSDDEEIDRSDRKSKPKFNIEEFRPTKRGRKKLSTKLKSKAAKREKLRREKKNNRRIQIK